MRNSGHFGQYVFLWQNLTSLYISKAHRTSKFRMQTIFGHQWAATTGPDLYVGIEKERVSLSCIDKAERKAVNGVFFLATIIDRIYPSCISYER